MNSVHAKRRLVKYTPTTRGRKWITPVTEPHGGLHKQEEFKRGVQMLEECAHNFRNPRLFHLCFTGAYLYIYQLVMARFCRDLKAQGVQYRYKAALELDSMKGLHFHVMIVLGTDKQTGPFIRNQHKDLVLENESSLRKAVRQTWNECSLLDYSVSLPKKGSGLPFLQFNQTNQEMFDEAALWLSYIYKARSKPEDGTVYFSDRQ